MKLLRLLTPLILAIAVHAAPLERDLGDGLVYFRVHAAPGDLPANEALRKRACVLDLRYAHAEPAATAVLSGWLKFHAVDKTPLFVLVNGATAAGLLAALEERDTTPELLVIGTAAERFAPDITVSQSSAEERRAYDALENGATAAALTTDNPNKQRNDEASLAHDHAPEAATADDDEAPRSEKAAATKARPPPIDAELQRAIQLHRALRAMKKA